jgi:hypothetical protein
MNFLKKNNDILKSPTKKNIYSWLNSHGIKNFYIENSKQKKKRIKKILNNIKKKKIIKVTNLKRKTIWDIGWKEVYLKYKASHKLSSLFPIYQPTPGVIRLFNEFVIFKDRFIFDKLSTIFLKKIFFYFKDCKTILDFGCGTGKNSILLKKNFPQKKIVSLDRSFYSSRIIEEINNIYKFDIKFKKFDFFKPNMSIKIPKNSGVLTVTALEQVGTKFKKFLLYLKKYKPSVIVNLEPEDFFYKKNSYDFSMLKFHKKKGYLTGYIKHLKYLEEKKLIKIICIQRLYFGSEDNEALNLIVWEFLNA